MNLTSSHFRTYASIQTNSNEETMPRKSANITIARKEIKHWPPKEYKCYDGVAIVIHFELGKQLMLVHIDKWDKKPKDSVGKENHTIFYGFNT